MLLHLKFSLKGDTSVIIPIYVYRFVTGHSGVQGLTWGRFLPPLILAHCSIKYTYHTQPCTVSLYIYGEGILSYFHLTSQLVTSDLLDLPFAWPYLLAPRTLTS